MWGLPQLCQHSNLLAEQHQILRGQKKKKKINRVCWAQCLAQGLGSWCTRAAKTGSAASVEPKNPFFGVMSFSAGWELPATHPVEPFKPALPESPEPFPASLKNQERATSLEHPGTSKGQGLEPRNPPPLGCSWGHRGVRACTHCLPGGSASLPFLRFPFRHQTEPRARWKLTSLTVSLTVP